MYIDNLNVLSADQALAAVVAGGATSTYYVDMLAAGFGHNDEVYAQFLATSAYTATAGASLTVSIVIANETTFASRSVVVAKPIYLAATGDANTVLATLKLGPDLFKQGSISGTDAPFRYLFATYTLTNAVASLTVDCNLVKDIDMTMDKVL